MIIINCSEQRKSEGLKLASIVSKDLRKHSVAFDKKKAATDNDSAPLELDLEHKQQTDACVEAFVPALQDTLLARDGVTPLRLEELSLRNNSITATALRLLAPIIEAARFDLRDIDLSNNRISVATKDEARAFADFLRAFMGCELMRRLDLSGNDFSGPLAMEVFLRVYCEQPAVDASLVYYKNGPGLRDADYEMLSERANGLSLSTTSNETFGEMCAMNHSLGKGRYLQRHSGLRAIPYIILRDNKIDDAGALHLSYVLEKHHWPQYLMTELKDGSREAKRKEEDDASGVFGLVFSENTRVSQYGGKVLDHANAARVNLAPGRVAMSTPQESWVDSVKVGTSSIRSRKMSIQSDSSGDRRTSGTSTSILSLRKRLQRTTIEKHGVRGVQLWHAAVKVLYAARIILPKSEDSTRKADSASKYVSHIQIANAVPGEPILMIIGQTNTPVLATVTQFDRQPVSPAVAHLSALQTHTKGNSGTVELRAPIKKHFDRDSNNPKGLPTWLWKKIILEYAEGTGVLNTQQIEKIVEYAGNRSNIMDEQHNQAKGETHQVWHVLEELECLTYEMK